MFHLNRGLPWPVLLAILAIVIPSGIILLLYLALLYKPNSKLQNADRIQLLVLGDIGRSPRMQYHALSIANHGGQVDLIGYRESALHPDILTSSRIKVQPLDSPPDFLNTKNKRLFLLYGPLKVIFQIWTICVVLGYKTKHSGWLLVQNPPSIPTLATAQTICLLRNTRLVIDWHNFGYSILALKLGNTHPLVRTSYFYERTLARYAYAHFCVTVAMARVLRKDYGITAPILPLHDRPASHFQVLSRTQRLDFLDQLPELVLCKSKIEKATEISDNNIRIKRDEATIKNGLSIVEAIKNGHTKLIVSSTSWTPDENFQILLSALIGYNKLSYCSDTRTEILAIITGKGPQKADFEAQVEKSSAMGLLNNITIKTAFFDNIKDYARLLGSADLGVSLHTSSSGVDLPMKVVDMFGAGLPVAGWGDFEAWPELVKEGVNGRSFKDAAGLEGILVDLFNGSENELGKLREGAIKEGERRWDDEWDPIAGKLFGLRGTGR